MSTFSGRPSSGDDGYTYQGAATWYGGGYLGYFGASYSYTSSASYARISNVTIPNGSTVSAATLTATSGTSQTATAVNVTVGLSNEDNAALPTTYSDANGRSFATGYGTWNNVPTTPAGESTLVSVDFATNAQNVFGRAGWSSGNAVLGMIRNNGSTTGLPERYRSHKQSVYGSSYGLLLSVTYTAPAGGGASAANLLMMGV